jgi:hypothetical protein
MKKLTPLFALLFLVFLASCSKEKDSDTTSQYPYYFTATIAGKSVKYEANDIDSRYGNGTASPSSSSGWDDYDIYEGTVFIDEQDLSRNNIHVLILQHFNEEPTADQRLAMFHTGSYGFGWSDVSPATVNGASIAYTDDQGVEWSSELGSQSGSTFNITELSDNTNGHSRKIFKANFSCKLYDGNGNNIQVTNAVVRGQVLPY